jgi:hypothetical protein
MRSPLNREREAKKGRPAAPNDDDDATIRIPRWVVMAPLVLPKGERELAWPSHSALDDATLDLIVDADESMALRGIRAVARDRSELSNEPTEDWIAHTLASCLRGAG